MPKNYLKIKICFRIKVYNKQVVSSTRVPRDCNADVRKCNLVKVSKWAHLAEIDHIYRRYTGVYIYLHICMNVFTRDRCITLSQGRIVSLDKPW